MEEYKILFAPNFLTEKQIKEHEKYIDSLSLDHHIEYNNKIIKTIKELKKIAKTIDILDSLEFDLSDQDYTCVFRWLNRKKIKKGYKKYNDDKFYKHS